MTRRRVAGCLAGALVVVGLVGPGAAFGAPPVIDRIPVDETFVDDELSEACGVAVTTTVSGQIIERSLSGEGTGTAFVRTINLGFTAQAGDRTFRFRDVGADVTRIEPDGTAVLLIVGQVPFDFAGALIIDLETGEAILEPKLRDAEQLARACEVLAGG